MKQQSVFLFLVLLLFSRAGAQTSPTREYTIRPGKSKLQISVYKKGVFKAFSHNHLVSANNISGRVLFNEKMPADSSVELTVQAASLSVIDPGESDSDRQQVQSTMTGKEVLDAQKYPEIRFTSTRVTAEKKTDEGWEIVVEGRLALHGIEKSISIPLHLSAKDEELRTRGEASLLQNDFGIAPIKVGGGTVRVKNLVRVRFDVIADALGQ
jgi:polyisoprenoid-binding protein YceI